MFSSLRFDHPQYYQKEEEEEEKRKKEERKRWASCFRPVIPVLGMSSRGWGRGAEQKIVRQEDYREFQVSLDNSKSLANLGYIVRLCLKIKSSKFEYNINQKDKQDGGNNGSGSLAIQSSSSRAP